MAKYDNRKFYWLQLKEDFFEDDTISWLEEQPNGKEYCLFYLKLCLKSLKTNGVLVRVIGDGVVIPYDAKKLSELTRTDLDTVTIAMNLLQKIGLVKVLDKGEICLPELENLIGQKSIGAFKKEQQRRLINVGVDKGVDKCPPDIDIDIDKELDIEVIDTPEKLSVDFVKSECEKISPTLFTRLTKKQDSEKLLQECLKTLTLSKQDLQNLLEKANKTYIVLPKYNNLDLIWVLNHREEVLNTNNRREEPPQQQSQLERAMKSLGFGGDR